jgi:UDP-N-acetylglucosamine:LPS N-acetylglucosamine transferase
MGASVLILHASVGTGHKAAALALEQAFKRRGADRVWVQETLDYGSGLFRRLCANLYIDLSEKTPELWGFAYHESKSGGFITSEVMARGTPLLVTEPIRRQEEFNADYVVTAGVGVQARLTDSVPYMVKSLISDAPWLASIRQNAALYGRPRAALDIADIVLTAID